MVEFEGQHQLDRDRRPKKLSDGCPKWQKQSPVTDIVALRREEKQHGEEVGSRNEGNNER